MLPYSSSTPSQKPIPPALRYEPPSKPPHKNPAVIIGSILGVVALAGISFAAYYIFFRKPLPNISVQVSAPAQVLLGEPFQLTVAYNNVSDQVLKNAVVAVTVPDGMAIIGVDSSTRLGQQVVGDVGSQGIGSKTFELVATNGENSVKHISVALRYRLGESQTPFERTGEADIAVGGPAVTLNFDVPKSVFSEQTFDASLTYQNNSETAFQNARLIFDYPQLFQFESASGSPSSGNNEWDLGTLAPGAKNTITVTGKTLAAQQSFFDLGVHLQVELNGRRYDLGAQKATIGIQNTPLSISVTANRKTNYVASLGDNISYTLNYRNSSRFALQNVVIQAALQGEMFNFSSITSAASLNSVDNTLTWNPATNSGLASLDPGESGSVEFRISLKKDWPINGESDKDFAVQVKGTIQSLTVPAGITAAETISSATTITKIAGRATMASLVYFKEPTGLVENIGPYPPRVNQPTQYTVHWQIRNYSTDISNVHLSALLQSGARLLKIVKSNAATSPEYDSRSGQVTWDIPSIPANQGLVVEPVEAIFQIEATPAINQLDRDIALLGPTTFTAVDAFTGTAIKGTALAKNSSLPDDMQAPSGNRKVQP